MTVWTIALSRLLKTLVYSNTMILSKPILVFSMGQAQKTLHLIPTVQPIASGWTIPVCTLGFLF